MLNKLLKYEFKSTARTMGGMYLILLAVAFLLGLMVRFDVTEPYLQRSDLSTAMWGVESMASVLALIYAALLIAIAVLTFVNIVQRFYKNLLGGEGYLMHTLPVSAKALLGSKLIAGVVWEAVGTAVSMLSMLLLFAVASLKMDTLSSLPGAIRQMLRSFRLLDGLNTLSFCAGMLAVALCSFSCLILCVYAACMIGHQFKRHVVPAGVAAYFALSFVQSKLLSALGIGGGKLVSELLGRALYTVSAYENLSLNGRFWAGVLAAALPSLAFALIYFFLTDWLLREHLNLE